VIFLAKLEKLENGLKYQKNLENPPRLENCLEIWENLLQELLKRLKILQDLNIILKYWKIFFKIGKLS